MTFCQIRFIVVAGTFVLACLISFVSFLQAAETEKKSQGRFPEKMIVTVVNESGQPIPHASGFHRFGKYVSFKADANGVFEIPMPPEEAWEKWQTTDFTVRADGYGPFSAHFDSDPVIPETFTVVLKPAQKIGGIVVDENDKPLEGAEVKIVTNFETSYKTPDIIVDVNNAITDDKGKWSFFQIPATFNKSPRLHISKKGYLTFYSNIPIDRFAPDADGNYHEKLTLECGVTISGKIVDKNGKPIQGATVHNYVNYNLSEPIISDANGFFKFENCPLEDRALLIVLAADKMTRLLPIEFRSDSKPLEIVMRQGRKVTFEVKDSSGKPMAGVLFDIVDIDGLSINSSLTKEQKQTDDNGQLIWNQAPDSFFTVTCNKKDYSFIQFSVEPNQEIIPVTLYYSKIKLRIVDDATDKPIPSFLVTQRMYKQENDENFYSWSNQVPGNNGFKEYFIYAAKDRAWRFDVEALGYETQKSRKVVYGEENVELEIRLVKSNYKTEKTAAVAENKTQETSILPPSGDVPCSIGKILTPDGKNAKNATIEIITADTSCGWNMKPVFSDTDGCFILLDNQLQTLKPQNFVLKITHTSGAAVITGEEFYKLQQQTTTNNSNANPTGNNSTGKMGTHRRNS
ncbi:MAG: carboxypeptidase-like regulatory domain-containing protein [Planctomycetaceae bacterium]|jgi:uncharacterized GH25 family protein|nr:carboxypeptidase-like regulatory domain-containing protein [Planctomycetaceae bacterium]